MTEDEKKSLFSALFEYHVEKGTLSCDQCKSIYKIVNGIPNMIEPVKAETN
jgi:uncharacterized protein YbaR (Trm112 family)